MKGVRGVGLAVATSGQEPSPSRQRGGHVDHTLARGSQLLGSERPSPPAPSTANRRSGHRSHQCIN
jgi:hypothetical protein